MLPANDRSPEEIERLLHQLELQQSELEAQNRRLQQQHDRYIDLYDSAPVGYATLDAEGYVQEVNLTGAGLLGVERDSLTGYPLADYVAKEDRQAFLDHVRQCIHEKREFISELRFVARGGRPFTVQLQSIPAKSTEEKEVTYCRTGIIDISERRQMEETIRRSQAFLQTVIDSIPDPMLVIDRDHRTVLANRAAREMAGEADPVSRCLTCYWLAHQRDLPCAGQNVCPLQQVVENHAPATVMHTRHGVNGEKTFIEVVAAPVVDKAGEVAHIIETRRDVTERQRMVEALRESEERLRLALEASGTAWWDWDLTSGALTTDVRCKALFGLPPTVEPSRELLFEHMHPEDRQFIKDQLAECSIRPGDYENEFRVIWPDGSVHWIHSKGRSIHDSDRQRVRLMGVATDITPRKMMEEALRESERRFAAFMRHLPAAAWIKDLEGRYVYANLEAERIFTTALPALLGKTDAEIFLPATARHFRENDRRALAIGGSIQTLEVLRQADGEDHYSLVSKFALPGNREPAFVAGVAFDITDQKRLEEQLRAARNLAEGAQAAAEHANRAKDHFLAVLSHELRTPLTPVVMGVSMLQDRPDIAPDVREMLEMVHRNVELEARLIDDLLDVSRIARGKIELSRRPVKLCTVIQRAVEVCQADIEARRLYFGVDLGPAAPYWVDADVPRLQQVFWNLLKNAIKFTPHGGCVGIRCRPNEKHVLVEVNDSGMGIEADALSRIFNAFEQAETSITRQFGGLGLGLAISKAIVEMHGGTIEAHSAGRDEGATFRICLPLIAPAGQPEVSAPAASPQRALRPLRILLVEDHGVTVNIMRKLLTLDGHTVETAGDVATALELTEKHTFDLLLSDLGLPDGSGHNRMRQLRERGHKFPGIVLSGYGQEEDIRRSYEVGFAAHLTKPVSREALAEAVASVRAG
jgi:PAS domain S-box-containing protein